MCNVSTAQGRGICFTTNTPHKHNMIWKSQQQTIKVTEGPEILSTAYWGEQCNRKTLHEKIIISVMFYSEGGHKKSTIGL